MTAEGASGGAGIGGGAGGVGGNVGNNQVPAGAGGVVGGGEVLSVGAAGVVSAGSPGGPAVGIASVAQAVSNTGTLTVEAGSTLSIPAEGPVSAELVNFGTIEDYGTIDGSGVLSNLGSIVEAGTPAGVVDTSGGLQVKGNNYQLVPLLGGFGEMTGADPSLTVYAPTVADSGQVLPSPSANGYTFGGWYTPGGTAVSGSSDLAQLFGSSTGAPLSDDIHATYTFDTDTNIAPPVRPPVFGQQVTLNVEVVSLANAAVPTGSVQFDNGNTALGGPVALLNGQASFTTSALPAGQDQISARYEPSGGDYGPSSRTQDLTVSSANTTTALEVTPAGQSVFGQVESLQATVAPVAPGGGVPTGTVQFYDAKTALGAPVPLSSGGKATLTTSQLVPGTNQITATYTPADGSYQASSAQPAVVTVVVPAQAPVAVTLSPVSATPSSPLAGQKVSLAVTLSPVEAGTVSFFDGAALIDRPVAVDPSGRAVVHTAGLTVGAHEITAVFTPIPGSGVQSATSAGSSVAVGPAVAPSSASAVGYRAAAADGGVFSYGGAGFDGGAAGSALVAPVVGGAATPDGRGYWLVGADGGVFAFGDAGFYGSAAGSGLASRVVGMAATPDGRGYWLVGADGSVVAFGDAGSYGSWSGGRLAAPIVGISASPDGRGYWLVGADGGVFAYGDARFEGSAAMLRLDRPVVGMNGDGDGRGYWLIGADGGVFAYGDASFEGSAAGLGLAAPITTIIP